MNLSDVRKGRIKRPTFVLVYGPEGVGKSTFGGSAPNAIFLDLQDGTDNLDVARFPAPKTWEEALDAPRVLWREKHEYKTFVVDPLGVLEMLVYDHVKSKVTSLKDNFYAGYELAREQWRIFLADCDRLRFDRDMHIVLVAHSDVKTFQNPTGPDYDQYRVSLQDKTAALVRQHVTDVLYATFETYSSKEKGQSKAKGTSTGKRVAYTEYRAGWFAKNRRGMPAQIPFSWEAYAEYLDRNIEQDSKAIREQAEKLTEQIKDEATREKARKFLSRKLSIDELRTALSRAEELVAEQQEAQGNG